jgi:hypothetical protein
LKPSRPLLLVGASDPQAVDGYAHAAKEAGFEIHVLALDGAEVWLENNDPIAIALDMTSKDAEASCLGMRAMTRLAQVPIVGLAAELDDLTFPEMYGYRTFTSDTVGA